MKTHKFWTKQTLFFVENFYDTSIFISY